jgi:hypothetical protein
LKFLLTGKGKLFILLPPSLILCDLSFPTVASSSSVETTISLENMKHGLTQPLLTWYAALKHLM